MEIAPTYMQVLKLETLGALGTLQAEHRAQPLKFRTRASALLLAYLAIYPDRPHRRDDLAQRFWPDATRDRQSLSMALTAFRQSLEADFEAVFTVTLNTVTLHAAAVSCDALAFQALLQDAERPREKALSEAIALYQGPFVAAYIEPNHARAWLKKYRQALHKQYQAALVEYALLQEQAGKKRAARETLRGVSLPKALPTDQLRAYLRLSDQPACLLIRPLSPKATLEDIALFERELTLSGEEPLDEERSLLQQVIGDAIGRLEAPEKHLLGILTLFPESASPEIVASIAPLPGLPRLIQTLQEAQLIGPSEAAPERLEMLRSVREAASELLTAQKRLYYQRRLAQWFVMRLYWRRHLRPAFSHQALYAPLFQEDAALSSILEAHLASGEPRDLRRAAWLIFRLHVYWELVGRPQERFRWLWRVFERLPVLTTLLPGRWQAMLWPHLIDSMGGCVDPAHWLPDILTCLPELESRVGRKRMGNLLMTAAYMAHQAERDAEALTLFAAGRERAEANTELERETLAGQLCAYSEALQVQGRFDEAAMLAAEALALTEGLPGEPGAARHYAGILLHLGRPDEAQAFAERGLQDIFPDAPPQCQELALRELGNVYLLQERYPLAAAIFCHALLLCEGLRAREPASDCHRGLGQIHLKQGQLQQAELHFQEGIRIWQERAHHRWQVVFLQLLARCALERQDWDTLEALLTEADTHLAQTSAPQARASALFLRAEQARRTGNLLCAIPLHREALALHRQYSPLHLQRESETYLSLALSSQETTVK